MPAAAALATATEVVALDVMLAVATVVPPVMGRLINSTRSPATMPVESSTSKVRSAELFTAAVRWVLTNGAVLPWLWLITKA